MITWEEIARDLYDTEAVAKMFDVDILTIPRWVKTKQFPKGKKIGPRKMFWLRSEIIRWIKTR